MKRSLLSFALCALVSGTLFTVQSCNKIKDEIVKQIDPISFTRQDISYTVPGITTTAEFSTNDTGNININQLIKDETGIDVNINKVSSIRIKKITLELKNADEENNWTNAEYIITGFQSKTGIQKGKQQLSWKKDIEDVESQKYAVQVIEPEHTNLKDYFNGDGEEVYYLISVKARRETKKELVMNATVEYEVKF